MDDQSKCSCGQVTKCVFNGFKETSPHPEPNLGTAIPNIIERAHKLLEWMPKGSAGSSGEMRRAAMEEAIEYLEAAWALARL